LYEAVDEYLGRRVAVKVVSRGRAGDPVFSAGQRKEARTLARLDHPNIVRVYDAGVDEEGVVYFVMERIDGVSLARLLQVIGAQEFVDALSIAVQIADALEVAHEAGVIHRDLKPENVLVMKSGLAKVVDFGVAKRDDAGQREDRGKQVQSQPRARPQVKDR
jgi:serine/threonine-protein kinase